MSAWLLCSVSEYPVDVEAVVDWISCYRIWYAHDWNSLVSSYTWKWGCVSVYFVRSLSIRICVWVCVFVCVLVKVEKKAFFSWCVDVMVGYIHYHTNAHTHEHTHILYTLYTWKANEEQLPFVIQNAWWANEDWVLCAVDALAVLLGHWKGGGTCGRARLL